MNDQIADILSPVPTVVFSVQPPAGIGSSASVISRHFFEALGDSLHDGVVFLDGSGRILYWNDAMAQLSQVAAADCVGTRWDSVQLHFASAEPGETTECLVTACLDRQVAFARTMKLIASDPYAFDEGPANEESARTVAIQAGRDVLLHATPLGMEHGGGAVVIVRDLSDRVEMQSQILSLHKKAMSDPLTGVANRAEFDQCLLRCTTEARQQGPTFSLIMCDIDHFKRINDIHGHPAGDEALIQFADVLRRQTRSSDLVVRYGGEEFVVLAISSDKATATRRANEIRQTVAATPLKGLGGQSITVSIGVAEYQSGDTPQSIVARADRALLDAKGNGRNRVE